MSCNHPLRAFKTGNKTENGKDEYFISTMTDTSWISEFELVHRGFKVDWSKVPFKAVNGVRYLTDCVSVPCGSCVGCRLDYAKDWRNRLLLESLDFDYCYFITLTYDDRHLPMFGLSKSDIQKFLKRLRKSISFRYFLCGEYGSHTLRPHYHIILFCNDAIPVETKLIRNVFRSSLIDKCWKFGLHEVSYSDESSMAYVCGYTLKKAKAKDIYPTGWIKPFVLMSRMPAIGSTYFENNKDSILETKRVYSKNGSFKVPAIFWRKFDSEDENYKLVKAQSIEKAKKTEELLISIYKNKSFNNIGSNFDEIQSYNLKNRRVEKL